MLSCLSKQKIIVLIGYLLVSVGSWYSDYSDPSQLPPSQVQYNKSQEVDSMANLHSEVDEVRGVMAKNIEKVMEKGEKLSRLEERTAELDANASQFKRTGVQLQRRMWWRNQKMKIVLVGTVTVILTIIILVICWQKGVFKKKKH
eukprot:sb/3473918/